MTNPRRIETGGPLAPHDRRESQVRGRARQAGPQPGFELPHDLREDHDRNVTGREPSRRTSSGRGVQSRR